MVAYHHTQQCHISRRPNMACTKLVFFLVSALLAVALAAPAEKPEKEDLVAGEKEDLQTAASHWGGHYGGWGGHYGYYPSYGYWGWPSYGYGYGYGWPYGYYGHQGYWW